MPFQKSVYIPELLVSDHFVMEHLLFLALMFQLSENFLGIFQVFKVHADHSICLQSPIQAMKLILVLLLDQTAQSVKDGEHS